MSKFLPASGLKWIDPKVFDLHKCKFKYIKKYNSKGCVLEFHLEYPKELRELYNDYALATNEIEIKSEILFEYQLKIASLCNIPIDNVKKLVATFFDKEKYVICYGKLRHYLRLELKLKDIHRVLEFNQYQWPKQYFEFNTQIRIEAEKNGKKDGKALYKLINNAVYRKAMEHLRNRIVIKLISNEKDYLRRTSKPSYMSHKIFDNDLVVILKNKVTLTLNRFAYIGMCILELRNVLMYEFHYRYIINKYGNDSRPLFTDTDSLMYEIKTEDVYKNFSNEKEMFDFSNYSTNSK